MSGVKIHIFWHRNRIFVADHLHFVMKRWILLAASVLLAAHLAAQPVRTCYRSGEISHISTEYEALPCADVPAARLRLERAGFPDGTALYVLYLKLEQETKVTAPKGVKLTAHLPGGKFVRLEQMGQDAALRGALENGRYLNRFKYPVSEEDLALLRSGVGSVEIVTGWGPDDVVSLSFPDNAFSALLDQLSTTVDLAAKFPAPTLDGGLAGYADNANTVMITAEARVARGDRYLYNIILSYLYYKNTDDEDVDLAFMIGMEDTLTIPQDTPVRFILHDGSVLELPQTRDDDNFVYLYPTLEDLRRMASVGIDTLSINTESGFLQDSFPAYSDFSAVLAAQLQLLLSASPL